MRMKFASALLLLLIVTSARSQCTSEERYWELFNNASNGIGLESDGDNLIECYHHFSSIQDTAFALYSLNYGIYFQIRNKQIYDAGTNLQLLQDNLDSTNFDNYVQLFIDYNYLKAILYYNLGNSDLCIYYSNEYIKLQNKYKIGSFQTKIIYDFLGLANIAIGDYDYSISNFENALEQSSEEAFLFNSRIQGHTAYSYLKLRDTVNAKKYLELAEQNITKDTSDYDIIYYYQYLATYYLQIENSQLAKKHVDLALGKNPLSIEKINLLILKGQIELLESAPDANQTFRQAYQLTVDSLGFNKYKVSDVLLNIGDSYLQQNNFDLSLNYLDLCIDLLWDNRDSLETILNPRILVESLTHKSYILSQQNKHDEAMDQAMLSTKVLNYLLKHKIHSIHSSTAFISKIKSQYAKIIESFNESNLRESSFILNQKTKAILLRIKIDEANTFKQFDLDDEEIYRISKLKNEINTLNSTLANPGKSIQNESINFQFQEKSNTLDSLIDNLELTSPLLYKLKYEDQKALTFKHFQKNLLTDKSALIEYYLGDKILYTYVVTNKKSLILSTPVSVTFTNHIYNLNGHIRSLDSEVPYDSYLESTEYLYDKLLKEIIAKVGSEINQLYIIPDDEINYIPFSVLFEKAPGTAANERYDLLPYIGKKYDISYHYSSALFDDNNSILTTDLSGFAPAFTSDYSSKADLDQLLYNQEEVLLIRDITDGEIHIDTSATLPNLRKSINSYKIAHLATHATCNDTLPFESKIHMEDGPLFAYEIYNMPHKLDLAVLSACQTGDGTLKKGEGLMSLARAFISSGCKSVITSLWSVNDMNSSALMQTFYQNLWSGKTVSASLAQSKRDYLKNVESVLQAHPFHWATFISIGNGDMAIFRIPWGTIFILSILILLISVIFIRILGKF